jgi:hypothetical protein
VRRRVVDAAFVVVLLVGFSLFVTGWHRSPDTLGNATTTESNASTTTTAPASSCDAVSVAVAPTTTSAVTQTDATPASPAAVSATVTVASVARRQTQTAYAYGFRPGETVTASLPAAGCDLGTTVADARAFVWTVGGNELLGDHEFVVTGESGTATAPFRVVMDEPVTTGGMGRPLLLPVLAALGLVALIYVLALRSISVKRELEGADPDDPLETP